MEGRTIFLESDPKACLFVFAHEDDELSSVTIMKKLVEEGKNVYIIWITDGSGTANPEVREQESRKLMKLLGVPSENLFFLGFKDTKSIYYLDDIVDKLKSFLREKRPSQIYVDAYEGGHPDHDVANFTTSQAVREMELSSLLYEVPEYNGYQTRLLRINSFIPAESPTVYTPVKRRYFLFKMRSLLSYRSQFFLLIPLVALLVFKNNFFKGEPCRLMPDWDYLKPPHEGKLAYERGYSRWFTYTFEDFRREVEKFYQKRKIKE